MEHLTGLEEAFKKAKVVFMTTFSGGKENTRQMTNFNENPYSQLWFPTEKDTKKVKDITRNPKVIITFPAGKRGEYFEIEGEASFADQREVEEKWEWWWLYWHPSQKDRFWFPPSKDERRVLINIQPKKARLIRK
jgi:general stress protein 26